MIKQLRAWFRRLRWRLWWRAEYGQRERLQQATFADGRFLLYLHLRGRPDLIAFSPREEEAPAFFKLYAVPIMLGRDGCFSHVSWSGVPGFQSVNPFAYRLELLRFRDVDRVELYAGDEAYRNRLATVLHETYQSEKIDFDLQQAETARMLGAIQAGEYVRRFKQEGG